MDTATNGSNSKQFAVDEVCKHFGVRPCDLTGVPSPAYSILPMIEQRIRASIRDEVDQTRKHLESMVGAELVKLGFGAELNKSWQFASEVAAEYGEMLVRRRINAIVDGLVSENPAKPADPDVRSYTYSKAPADAAEAPPSIITVNMPPNMTQEQRDKVIADLKAHLPDAHLVPVVGGAQLGRI